MFSDIKVYNGDGTLREVIPLKEALRRKPRLRVVSDREGQQYHNWRKDIKERDKYRCVLCEDNHRLEVHHIERWIDNEDDRFNLHNGVTLCYECHSKYHGIHNDPFPKNMTETLLKYIDFKYNLTRVLKTKVIKRKVENIAEKAVSC